MVFETGSGWPGIHCVDQAGLQFIELFLQVVGLNASTTTPSHECVFKQKAQNGMSEMAQWVKALAPTPHVLTSIPSIHLVEEENQLP